MTRRVRPLLLVFGDSQSFHGPERAEPADDPRLWPNVAAAALGGRAELVAGIGWTARHAWHALTGDPRVWSVLPHVDADVQGKGRAASAGWTRCPRRCPPRCGS